MRDDFTQHRLRLKYELLKVLKQKLAAADEIPDPVNRATTQLSLRYRIEEVEKQIDEIMRRA